MFHHEFTTRTDQKTPYRIGTQAARYDAARWHIALAISATDNPALIASEPNDAERDGPHHHGMVSRAPDQNCEDEGLDMSVRCRISPCLDTGGIRSVVVPYANVQLRPDDHEFGMNLLVSSISVDAGKC